MTEEETRRSSVFERPPGNVYQIPEGSLDEATGMERAKQALTALLAELPAEFSEPVGERSRESFQVVKERNVRRVHESLLVLKEYFDEIG